jgi:ASC-1-like (ASCH) protein|tara:strand:- start:3869 stop:4150 length:282 start_codon:yes stop_codon:yes gene_type:complete
METKEAKLSIIQAGRTAVEELIKVAREPIVTGGEDDVSADRLKNAAATKKLAIFDAFEILNRINEEENMLNNVEKVEAPKKVFSGFAENRSKK